ncbi:MAG: hypothetical protein KY455_01760 [Euryarchaeota archaeon]|nr:hypothetical protein [Euryarchaeota archaeon]
MKRLGLLTQDFRVLHELVRRLNSRGVLYRVLDPHDPVPPDVGAILTSWRDFIERKKGVQKRLDGNDAPKHGRFDALPVVSVRLDESGEEDYERAITEARRALSGIESYKRLIVGIDPGDHPGVAFLGDGVVVHTANLPDPLHVIDHLKNYLPSFPTDEIVIRVGHGARLFRNRILNDVMDLKIEDVRVELVDETGTNPQMIRRPSLHVTRDIQAAIGIGMTPGKPVDRKMRLDVLPGEIAEIQRKSRIQSDGEITVNRILAGRVARGDITMGEAIQEQRAVVRAKREGAASGAS